MQVTGLSVNNYRNYAEAKIEPTAGINIFLGANAQGKTNILESVRYVSLGRSHRTRNEEELINWQSREAYIGVDFVRQTVANRVEYRLRRRDRLRIQYNSHPVKHSEFIGSLNTVLFSPEDLLLVKGSPLLRRRFLDGELSQTGGVYYSKLVKYNRLLAQRNILLKKIRDKRADLSLLDVWEPQLAICAASIVQKRRLAVAKLGEIAAAMQEYISGGHERMEITYSLSGLAGRQDFPADLAAWYGDELAKARERDIWRGTTSVGPHHDDLHIALNGVNLRSFGSQGQQRTGVLALKLAELKFLQTETGEYPILLLDDVMSELDKSRREKLLDFIRRETIQTLVTATEEAYFPSEREATVFEVQHGTVTRR